MKKLLINIPVIIFSVLILRGCFNPFLPSIKEGDYIRPVEPELVIDNLVMAFNSRDILSYVNCLDPDSFRFFFDSAEDSIEEILRQNLGLDSLYWGIEEERLSTEALFNSAQYLYLEMIYIGGFRPSEDRAALYYDYHMEIIPSPEQKPIEGRGYFILKKHSDGLWYILEWHDFTYS